MDFNIPRGTLNNYWSKCGSLGNPPQPVPASDVIPPSAVSQLEELLLETPVPLVGPQPPVQDLPQVEGTLPEVPPLSMASFKHAVNRIRKNIVKSISEEQVEEVAEQTDFQSLIDKARSYTRLQVGLCIFIWVASFLAYMGAEWLHTRQQPSYLKVVPRPSRGITITLRTSGALSVLVGPSGWWGALNERYDTLLMFSMVTFLSSVLEISCGSVTIAYKGKVPLLMEEDVNRNLKRVTDSAANETTDNFLELQQALHCCGVRSYRDWIESPWWKSQRQLNSSLVVPSSCCISAENKQNCSIGEHPFTEVNNPELVYKVGCLTKISEYLDFLFLITGNLAFIGGTLKFFGFFLLNIFGNIILGYQQQIEQDVQE